MRRTALVDPTIASDDLPKVDAAEMWTDAARRPAAARRPRDGRGAEQ
jgi:hypothetical protein